MSQSPTKQISEDAWQPRHCGACGRFLLLHAIDDGAVQVKCKCKTWNLLQSDDENGENGVSERLTDPPG